MTGRARLPFCLWVRTNAGHLLGPIAASIVLVPVLCFFDGRWLGGFRLPGGRQGAGFVRWNFVPSTIAIGVALSLGEAPV
jgi:hypothetical protein